MVKPLVAAMAALVAIAGPAAAQDLQGRWIFQRQGHNGTYFGVMVVNERGEVRLKGTSPTQNYSECGYVQVQGSKIDVIFTTARGEHGYNADHFYCKTPAGGALECINVDSAGQTSGQSFSLTRSGGIPATPAERLEDVCPPGQIPRS